VLGLLNQFVQPQTGFKLSMARAARNQLLQEGEVLPQTCENITMIVQDLFSIEEDIPKMDSIYTDRQFRKIEYLRLQYHRLRDWAVVPRVLPFWEKRAVMEAEEAHQWIHNRIVRVLPTAVGRIGGVEAMIGLWANSIPMKPSKFVSIRMGYWETILGAANAGIRPRNRVSYRAFGRLLLTAIQHLDLMGVVKTLYEAALLQQVKTIPLFAGLESLGPTFQFKATWMNALDGKTVLVVSPFIDSYQKQLGRLREVWPAWEKIPNFTIKGVKFPYLIDDDCPVSWWEVYRDIASVIRAGDYDVALFGCGGLGLPLAAMTRQAGKIGIHLGAHLQLLFGVYGQRFLDYEWHKYWINDSWVRPEPHEIPRSSGRVERGAYW
jgi:hypothetical protein